MQQRRWWYALAVVALLGWMATAMVTTAVRQAPTIDEPVYVASAVTYTDQHSLRYNPEHPPLAKLVIAVGLAFTDAGLDPAFRGDQGDAGRRILYESGHDPRELMLAARLPMIALTLAFGLVVLAFGRDLTGPTGGLVALSAYSLSPDVVAHGALATLDVLTAGLLLTTAWLLWRARDRPRLHLPLAGRGRGAARATKANTLVIVPVVLLLAAAAVWRGRPRSWRTVGLGVAAAAGVAALAVAVVWATYLAVDPRLRWTAPPGLPDIGGLRAVALDLLPFPRPYADGMRIQFGFEDARWGGFLLGHPYVGSRWYYLPVALLIKTPLGLLALWAAGFVTVLAVRRLRPAAPYLLAVPLVLGVAAMSGSRDYGTRYVVSVPVFLAVAAASLTLLRWRWAPALLIVLVAVSSVRTFPYYLQYSNEAFGGTANTSKNLHDSNVDWGQDLDLLAARLRSRYPGERVWLVYKGAGVPAWYGISADDPLRVPPEQVRGLLVVSDSRVARPDRRLRTLLASATEIDDVGHSITIYRR